MRELQQAVYQAGEDVGMQLVGRSDWGEFTESLAGQQRDPLLDDTTPDTSGTKIGMTGEMTVAVGADGQLVNQARHRREGDAPSTHLLKIWVAPTVTFGVDGNVPIIRWIANVTVFELTNSRIVLSEESADEAGERALAGDRPRHVYANDPAYRGARPGFLHETPREAVRAALEKISSNGLINLPEPPDPPTVAPTAPTTAMTANGGRPGWLLPLVGLAGGLALIALLLVFTGGGDPGTQTAVPPATTATTDQPATAIAPPPDPATTSTTTTQPPVVIDETVFEILDQRCVVLATGEPSDGCIFPGLIALSDTEKATLRVGLPNGAIFDPAVVGTVSLSLTGGPANDIILECDTAGECQAWAAPSFFTVLTPEWMPIQFLGAGLEATFEIPIKTDDEGRAWLDLPAGETQQEQIPAGTYSVTQGVFYIDADGRQSTTLWADAATVWFG
jgi:hypothetical protein